MGWLGPWLPPAKIVNGALAWGRVGAQLIRGQRWWLYAGAVGVVPLGLGALLGSAGHQSIAAFLLFWGVLGALWSQRWWVGLALPALAFFIHCVAGVFLASRWPDLAAACFTDGPEYWSKNLHWIRTGEDPEYVLSNWVPAHGQLAAVVAIGSYLTLGFLPFLQGFYEVDLMNFYAGRLLAQSTDPWTVIFMGWHPWSVTRGVAYTVLVYELTAWSYQRLTARAPFGPGGRPLRLGVAAALLVLDGVIKYLLLDPVRLRLAANLTEGAL